MKWIVRTLFFLFGIFCMAFGIALIIKAGLGASAWDTLFVALSQTTGLTVGTCVFIVQGVLLFLNAALVRRPPEWLSLGTVFVNSVAIDVSLLVFLEHFAPSGLVSYVSLGIGIACMAAGVAVYVPSGFPKSQIDGLMLALHARFRLGLGASRIAGEVAALGIALLLGGLIGIGTLVATMLVGPLIQAFMPFGKKALARFEAIREANHS
ncbi:membrane protein [Paenibacillus antri]|uniref:Membrane protein n=1 Tax=Paenibacillus antri TaxID=2582848 RepID=A0A5R9GCI9_9BACL|nr:YitT family protein [Paenibacillus antri]TLS51098.1 membrane protein [Paenibacillus antri]